MSVQVNSVEKRIEGLTVRSYITRKTAINIFFFYLVYRFILRMGHKYIIHLGFGVIFAFLRGTRPELTDLCRCYLNSCRC